MRAIASLLSWLFALSVVMASPGAAHAQPSAQPQPHPLAPALAPAPAAPPVAVPPPYQYMPAQLTAEDQELLEKGEISDRRHVGGIIASLFFGLGIGQAVQGRYGETGWIFTVGETVSTIALVAGFVQILDRCLTFDQQRCDNNTSASVLLFGGLIGELVFRIWEITDAITGPDKHNRKVRALRMRLGMPPVPFARRIEPYVAPPLSRDGGATAGLTLRF